MVFFVNLLVVLGIVGAGAVLVEGCKETPKRPDASKRKPHPYVAKGFNRNGYEIDGMGNLIHRLISAFYDGTIPARWVVHHCDGKILNNDIDNLCQMPAEYHDSLHIYMKQHRRYFNKAEILARMKVEGVERPN